MSDEAAMVCPRCGTPAGSDRFCSGCGLNLKLVGHLPTAEEYEAAQREKEWLARQAKVEAADVVPASQPVPKQTAKPLAETNPGAIPSASRGEAGRPSEPLAPSSDAPSSKAGRHRRRLITAAVAVAVAVIAAIVIVASSGSGGSGTSGSHPQSDILRSPNLATALATAFEVAAKHVVLQINDPSADVPVNTGTYDVDNDSGGCTARSASTANCTYTVDYDTTTYSGSQDPQTQSAARKATAQRAPPRTRAISRTSWLNELMAPCSCSTSLAV